MLGALVIIGILVLAQQPDDVSTRFSRGVQLQQQGNWKEAEAEFRAVLVAAPAYAEAHANLGAVLSRLGEYEGAIAAYEAALKLKPGLTPVLLNLGIAHYRAGQFQRAIDALGRFLEAAPDHLQARQLIGLSLVELGRDAEAIGRLEPTLGVGQDDVTVLYSLGLAYLRTGRGNVETIRQRLASRADGVPLAHLLEGQAHLESADFEKAVVELESAQKLAADLPRLQFSLGLAYLKVGRYGDARACLQRELKRTPNDFLAGYYFT